MVQKKANAYAACVQKNWSPDAAFMQALRALLKGNVNEDSDHHIIELYETQWIQDRVPDIVSKFVSDATGDSGCVKWSKTQWQMYWFRQDFPNHVKCETVPSYHWQRKKTKKGKTKVTEKYQCAIPGMSFDSACYHVAEGETWACGNKHWQRKKTKKGKTKVTEKYQ